jgi:hypothetical protein
MPLSGQRVDFAFNRLDLLWRLVSCLQNVFVLNSDSAALWVLPLGELVDEVDELPLAQMTELGECLIDGLFPRLRQLIIGRVGVEGNRVVLRVRNVLRPESPSRPVKTILFRKFPKNIRIKPSRRYLTD